LTLGMDAAGDSPEGRRGGLAFFTLTLFLRRHPQTSRNTLTT
jgi:hypothetical protein